MVKNSSRVASLKMIHVTSDGVVRWKYTRELRYFSALIPRISSVSSILQTQIEGQIRELRLCRSGDLHQAMLFALRDELASATAQLQSPPAYAQ